MRIERDISAFGANDLTRIKKSVKISVVNKFKEIEK